ncbi:DUF2314 domain-containing protein [Thioclava sp. FR2]|uniref:DUF2314 domain-containing protein n=1 Tax=Thioclava sp. FR2 TaxID=3445780 RepID=UPI003EB8D68C
MSDDASFTLEDGRKRAAEAPYTFFLPSPAELAAIGPGDAVKLIFVHRLPVEEWESERMWVKVVKVDGDRLVGELDNIPDEKSSPLRPGDRVEFGRHNIISVQFRDPETKPEPYGGNLRTYWDR